MRVLALMLMLALAGCQSIHYDLGVPQPGESDWAPTLVEANAQPGEDGSLYAPAQMFTLFQDRRAYRVGDILTIVLDEQTQSSKRADTSLDKQSSMGIGAPVFGNKTFNDLGASVDANRNFAGGASASQQNSLSGFITVTVAGVMANGVLAVRGEKWIKLNQGDEFLRLKGLVRVDDIDQQNRVSSQRVANAQITYAGRGSLAETNQPGWLTRFFQSPLFPF
ncbi:flagellar basal body L-ring protein FlgH [Gallaecimonas xiamenensis]|uniref:Flagellar L-ring protein n=1 Tax=Gallaecimonas xiamenensis 3-C-1 TaxID=745411 RepID=K2JUB3_9GAMM|nr:flagellar basal body L-ring protein FlgH [Gallaecimonas xiamenensis]EKE73979.1 lateral flagellar L-ring protein, LfgH [Gallaecimonas xiamenensis 3-C-1]